MRLTFSKRDVFVRFSFRYISSVVKSVMKGAQPLQDEIFF